MTSFDFAIIGAGVMGTSVAHHLTVLGAKSVLVIEQRAIGAGTTSQSSGLLRSHYSVRQNIELARSSYRAFKNFREYLEDEDASSGLVECGYMVCAGPGQRLGPLCETLRVQAQMGIEIHLLSKEEARERLPIAQFEGTDLIGFEPQAGYADAYLVTTGFARSARRRGAKIMEGVRVIDLIKDKFNIVGVRTTAGDFHCGMLISVQGIWTSELSRWAGTPCPVKAERHAVLALESNEKYSIGMPALKDLASEGMLYYRSYGGSQMLVSEGVAGETLHSPETEQANVSLDYIGQVGTQVARRFPGYETADLAGAWTGVYDVTPDWNPVLGSLGDIKGLTVGFGFSGHGFKLSPSVGKLLAQHAMGLSTDIPLAPYKLERFSTGTPLIGKYGVGAVS